MKIKLSVLAHFFEKVLVLSDSARALLILLNRQINFENVLKCRFAFKGLGQRIAFQWILAHCGAVDSEKPDALAKKLALIE